MRRCAVILLGLILFSGWGLAAAEPARGTVASSTAASVAHYSYPPPAPPSPFPVWWQKTARVIRFWAEAIGSSVAGVVRPPPAVSGK